jgi:hypothetical protein
MFLPTRIQVHRRTLFRWVKLFCEQVCTNNIGGCTCSCQCGYRFMGGQCLGESISYVNKWFVATHVLANVDIGSWEGSALVSQSVMWTSDLWLPMFLPMWIQVHGRAVLRWVSQLCEQVICGCTCSCQCGYRFMGGQCLVESVSYVNKWFVATHAGVNKSWTTSLAQG